MEELDRSAEFSRPSAMPSVQIVAPNNPPWNSWIAIAVWGLSVLAIIVFPLFFLAPYIAMQSGTFGSGNDLGTFLQSDPTAIVLQVASVFPAHAVTLLAAWFVVTCGGRNSFKTTLGWKGGGVAWWHYVAFIVFFFGVASLVEHYIPDQENEFMRMLRSSRAAVVLIAIMATFTAPLIEEVVYRGLLYSAFQRTFGSAIAVVGVTLMFAAVHLPQYYPSVSTMILLTLLSLALTVFRAWSGNLLPCIVLHTIFNGIQSAILLIDPTSQFAPEKAPAFLLFLQ